MKPPWMLVAGRAVCEGCGEQVRDPFATGPTWCRRCPPTPRRDGAWRNNEEFTPRHPIPADARWWRRKLDATEVVKYAVMEANRDGTTAATKISLVHGDGTEWPLRADDITRLVVTVDHAWAELWGGDIIRALTSPTVIVDALVPFPTTPFARWRPLTSAGQFKHPLLTDPLGSPPPIRRGIRHRRVMDTESTWLPR